MKKIKVGFLLSILPIYSFFSWLYIFNTFPEKKQSFRIKEFNKLFFDISINQTTLAIINIILSLTSIYFLLISHAIKSPIVKVISRIVIVLLLLITLYNFWGLL